MPGSPIRTPPDQRSLGSSPGPNAAHHVLHRLLVPRHPPCALNHLHTPRTTRSDQGHNNRNQTNNGKPPSRGPPDLNHTQSRTLKRVQRSDARIHYPVHKHPTATRTPNRHARHPRTHGPMRDQHPNRNQRKHHRTHNPIGLDGRACSLRTQQRADTPTPAVTQHEPARGECL